MLKTKRKLLLLAFVSGCGGGAVPSGDYGPRSLPYVPAPKTGPVMLPPLPPAPAAATRISEEGAWSVRAAADGSAVAWADYSTKPVLGGGAGETLPAPVVRALRLGLSGATPITLAGVDSATFFGFDGDVAYVLEGLNQVSGTANLVVWAPGMAAGRRLAENAVPFIRVAGGSHRVAWLAPRPSTSGIDDLVWVDLDDPASTPVGTWLTALPRSCPIEGLWLPDTSTMNGNERFVMLSCGSGSGPSGSSISLWTATPTASAPVRIVGAENIRTFFPSVDGHGAPDGRAIAFVTSTGRLMVTRLDGNAPFMLDEGISNGFGGVSPGSYFPSSPVGYLRTLAGGGLEATYFKGEQIVQLTVDSQGASVSRTVVAQGAKAWAPASLARYPVDRLGGRVLFLTALSQGNTYGAVSLAVRNGGTWAVSPLTEGDEDQGYAGDEAFAEGTSQSTLYYDRARPGTLGVGRLSSRTASETTAIDDRAWLVELLPGGHDRAAVLAGVNRLPDALATHEGKLVLFDLAAKTPATAAEGVTSFTLLGPDRKQAVFSRRDGVYLLDVEP